MVKKPASEEIFEQSSLDQHRRCFSLKMRSGPSENGEQWSLDQILSLKMKNDRAKMENSRLLIIIDVF